MILITFRTKKLMNDRQDLVRRERKDYDQVDYARKIAELDWNDLYESRESG